MTTYKEAGVDVNKNDRLVEKIKQITNISTGFAASDKINLEYTEIVQCTDGVGTKMQLAHQFDAFDTVGQDLVAMVVNDLICAGAIPMYLQDYIGMNCLDEGIVVRLISSIQHACQSCGIRLTGGEMAEMPGTYATDAPEVVAFATGFTNNALKRFDDEVEEGFVIIGLQSSGPHSNGYTLINNILDSMQILPESSIINALLKPTTIYTEIVELNKYCANHLTKIAPVIGGIAHITGGGLESNINRTMQPHLKAVIDWSSWTVPQIFDWIQKMGNVPMEDMRTTFNMGIGMCLIVDPDFQKEILQSKYLANYSPKIIGEVVAK